MDDRNSTSGRSSEEIRAEIDRTRADMHNTVDQLEARLSPGQILDELWGRMRQGGGAGGAGELVREHPVPLALMGLGVAMLAVEHSKHKSSHGSDAYGYVGDTGRAEGRKGPYRGDDVDHVHFNDRATGIGSTSDMGSSSGDGDGAGGGLKGRVSGVMDSAKDAVSGAGEKLHGVTDRVGDAAGSLKDKASHLADGAGERASELRGRAGETAGNAIRGLDRIIHDQPLIAGAITFGLGLAAGLAVPATRFEDERLGATSDELKDNAKQAASQVGERALEVASQTAGAIKDAASEIKDEINDPQLKDALLTKARSVAEVAKSTLEDTVEKVGGSVSASSGGSSNATTGTTGSAGSTGSTGSGAASESTGSAGSSMS